MEVKQIYVVEGFINTPNGEWSIYQRFKNRDWAVRFSQSFYHIYKKENVSIRMRKSHVSLNHYLMLDKEHKSMSAYRIIIENTPDGWCAYTQPMGDVEKVCSAMPKHALVLLMRKIN